MTAFASYADYYSQGPHARFQHETRSLGSMPVRLLRAQQGAHELDDPAVPEVLIGLVLAGSGPCRWTWGDGWNDTAARRAGEFGISPANTAGRFETRGWQTMLIVGLPVAPLVELMAAEGRELPAHFGPLHGSYRSDATVARLCRALWYAAADSDEGLNVEATLLSLIDRLYVQSTGAQRHSRPILPLRESDFARVQEAMLESLCRPPTLRALAGMCRMSPSWFVHAFKARAGMSPYRFHMQLRIERACERLRFGSEPVAAIADDLGFAHQSHFTRVFTKLIGVAPATYRRLMRG